MKLFPDFPQRAARYYAEFHRPLVTLTYAQSLDGSISIRRGLQLELSGEQSQTMTHHLRAMHDVILVGIGTVLADDPRLSARLANGKNPQPVIVDTHLRLPLSARLLQNPNLKPWIMAGSDNPSSPQSKLESSGAKIFSIPILDSGLIDLRAALDQLGSLGIKSLMVEGGARIITSFLTERLANWLILTIAPTVVGGLNAIDPSIWGESRPFSRLHRVGSRQLGDDVILWGDLSENLP